VQEIKEFIVQSKDIKEEMEEAHEAVVEVVAPEVRVPIGLEIVVVQVELERQVV
jgi:hypothetical protein